MLKKNDHGDAVKELQRSLNRLGSLLLIDGDFGPSTEAAVVEARQALGLAPGVVADDELLARLAAVPEPSPELTSAGVTLIAREEISSPSAYRKTFARPVWPTENSGITIGIGYDLKFADRAKLEADWGAVLPAATLDRLAAVSGTAGSAQRLQQVADVEIPLLAAVRVFLEQMLPEHIGHTRSAYPTLDQLPAHRRAVLVSLVFNRGGSLDGDRRREMKRIRELLGAGDEEGVPAQLQAMTRLWDPVKERGVIERRQREATLWRKGFAALQLV